ncbi:MAG: cyclic nucleotide-binding domain-containing protein [Nitrospinota bacterium]|nr:cyclic nucleotide-binding domain-containing protein [Nitrospinota bacterium]
MERGKDFEIYHGRNYRVLKTREFGDIVFGCPPGIVKDFAKRGEDLPSQYVFPIRTFVKGRSNFDFEFIVYSFLFLRSQKTKISIYCSPDQEIRFRIVLEETLFGPRYHNLLKAQFRKIGIKNKFTPKETQQFNSFLESIAVDKKLYCLFEELLRDQVSQATLDKKLKEYFQILVARKKWLTKKNIFNLAGRMAKNYLICSQLRKEIDLFGLTEENKRDEFINETLDFNHFDKNGAVLIPNRKDKRKKLKMAQIRPSVFEITQGGKKKGFIEIAKMEPVKKNFNVQPIKRPFMGVTFLGVGSGFSPKHENSCLIVWTEGKGIMVDVVSESYTLAMKYGITENDVNHTFLTHVHSDHDGGIMEKILHGRRVKVISSRIIFESFLRKVEAITCLPMDIIESFCDFIEVEPHKTIKLPGFKHSYFTFDHSLHSIPTGRFTLTYKNNGSKRTISHSGDTKYDEEKINGWYEQGVFTESRRDDILGFIWNADLIIHDVGGGTLHTELDDLKGLDPELVEKMILVHQDKEPDPDSHFRFAPEGKTEVVIEERRSSDRNEVETIKQAMLFSKLQQNHLLELFSRSKVQRLKDKEIVFSQNDIGNSFYVILEGFAEIIINGKLMTIYEKGNFFGELAITTNNPLRRATVRAKGPLTLLKIHKKYYKRFNLPTIQENLYKLRNFFTDILNPGLLVSLAFGELVKWNKSDTLIRYGDIDTDMYVILSGEVSVLDKKGKDIASLSDGDIVGEVACVRGVPRTATVVAKTDDVYAVRLRADEIQKVMKLFPSFFGTVYQTIKKRVPVLS